MQTNFTKKCSLKTFEMAQAFTIMQDHGIECDEIMNGDGRSVKKKNLSECRGPVSIFWDLENIQIINSEEAKTKISKLKKIISQIGNINEFVAICNIEKAVNPIHKNILYNNGVSIKDVPTRRPDAADIEISLGMAKIIYHYPPPYTVVIMSNDSDFVPMMLLLDSLGYDIVLIRSSGPISKILLDSAHVILEWDDAMFSSDNSQSQILESPKSPTHQNKRKLNEDQNIEQLPAKKLRPNSMIQLNKSQTSINSHPKYVLHFFKPGSHVRFNISHFVPFGLDFWLYLDKTCSGNVFFSDNMRLELNDNFPLIHLRVNYREKALFPISYKLESKVWIHIAFSCGKENTFYINGKPIVIQSIKSVLIKQNHITFGSVDINQNNIQGSIRNVRIYKMELNAKVVNESKNLDLFYHKQLLAYWPLICDSPPTHPILKDSKSRYTGDLDLVDWVQEAI